MFLKNKNRYKINLPVTFLTVQKSILHVKITKPYKRLILSTNQGRIRKITKGITFKPKCIKQINGWSALLKLKNPLLSIV